MRSSFLLLSAALLFVNSSSGQKLFSVVPEIPASPFISAAAQGTYPDSSENYKWDTDTGKWDYQGRSILTFDANGNLTQVHTKDPASGIWIEKLNYTYDANGKLLSETIEILDTLIQQTVKRSRDEYTYDAAGNPLSYLSYTYDVPNNKWKFVTGKIIEYQQDANNRITELAMYDTTSSGREPARKTLYLNFNVSDEPASFIIQDWNGSWEDKYKFDSLQWEVGYNPTEPDPSVYHGYIFNGSNWVKEAYDSSALLNGKRSERYIYLYLGGSSTLYQRMSYFYDSEEHNYKTVIRQFNGSDFIQVGGNIDSNVYGSAQEVLLNIRAFFNPSPQVNDWQTTTKNEYYYSTTGMKEPKSKALSMYPNPCRDYLILNLETEEPIRAVVFDMRGRQVKNEWISSGEPLNTGDLETGVYVIKANGKTGRFVKE